MKSLIIKNTKINRIILKQDFDRFLYRANSITKTKCML